MSKSQKLRNIETSPRAFAIDLLALCEDGAFANDLVPNRLSKSRLNPKDRAVVTNIVYSTLRNQIRIDFALQKVVDRPLNKLDLLTLIALRTVVSQMMSGFDVYAVVDETVKVLPFRSKGFVNGVSRTISRLYEKGLLFTDEPDHVKASLPEWTYDEIEKVFINLPTKQICDALNSAPHITLADLDQMDKTGLKFKNGELVESAILLESSGDLNDLEQIKNGEAIVVDQGSQFIARVVNPSKDETVLDVCCAPGGKSFLLAVKAKKVVANDISESRLRKMLDTQSRVNMKNLSINVGDARDLSLAENELFDKVLVDAPCSGLGVLRRRPDARHRITKSQIVDLVQLQKEIFSGALKRVKPGGKIFYSVCTFTNEETIDFVDWVEKEFPALKVLDIPHDHELLLSRNNGILVIPTKDNDSMFIIGYERPID